MKDIGNMLELYTELAGKKDMELSVDSYMCCIDTGPDNCKPLVGNTHHNNFYKDKILSLKPPILVKGY